MLRDARAIDGGAVIETDVCVVGAGAAGITLARELSGQPFRVCVLESGGIDRERRAQGLLRGESVGIPYEPLHIARSTRLGGTTDRWAGTCRPLDPIDLETRDWVSLSGWPFARAHLDRFYERAHTICQLGPFAYETERWQDRERSPVLRFSSRRVETAIYQFSPPTRFGLAYREDLEASPNVTVWLHATALDLETNDTATAVKRVRVGCLRGPRFSVSAKLFVLAGGGLENPRLLLLSSRVRPSGPGNDHDLVGRCFMEHLDVASGVVVRRARRLSAPLYRLHYAGGALIRGALTLSAETQRREGLLNQSVVLQEPVPPALDLLRRVRVGLRRRLVPDTIWLSVKAAFGWLPGRVAPRSAEIPSIDASRRAEDTIHLVSHAEQSPNPSSRVTLGSRTDAFGRPRARLDWQLSPIDTRSIRRTLEIVADEIVAAGVGAVRLTLDPDKAPWREVGRGSFHHMGTTRMHADPHQGVVDAHCRVHGVANLFVAGSSVFPTGGYANPTLTIVALAVRLADHLKRLLEGTWPGS